MMKRAFQQPLTLMRPGPVNLSLGCQHPARPSLHSNVFRMWRSPIKLNMCWHQVQQPCRWMFMASELDGAVAGVHRGRLYRARRREAGCRPALVTRPHGEGAVSEARRGVRVKQVTLARKPGPQKKSCPWKKPMQCGDIMDLMDCPNDANSLIGANPGSVILPVRTIYG